jgi:hypothetical protein
MHGAAPPHFLQAVTKRLNQTFGEQSMDGGVQSAGPHDLLDVAVGPPKYLVYSELISDLEVLQQD